MLVRIVKMTFIPGKAAEFLDIFNRYKKDIRSFPGCTHLALMKEPGNPNVMTTMSQWESEKDLEAYRNSEVFKLVWEQVKPLFAEKTVAFSLEKLIEVRPV